MVQEIKNIDKELMTKIVRLQKELDEIKSHIGIDQEDLKKEMKIWEISGVEDSVDFFEEYSL